MIYIISRRTIKINFVICKKVFLFLTGLVVSMVMLQGQNDTMYVMKSGSVLGKYKVSEIDSLIFYKPQAISSDPAQIKKLLDNIYVGFIKSGTEIDGDYYIPSADQSFFSTSRSLWNLQEITTDEAICAWADAGISDLNTMTWDPSNPFITALFQRLGISISLANDLIKLTKNENNPDIMRYNAEARFLRALAYYWYIDLFGNPPFTTEENSTKIFLSDQLDPTFDIARKKLFNYIITELKDIENKLGDPGFSYPQADKACVWMLLSRLYLNAEVYTGISKWDSCVIFSDKVINSAKYSLATNYRQNFSADNGRTDGNNEMIFAFAQDGFNLQAYVGTTFIIQSCSDPVYLDSKILHGLSVNANWNGNRATRQFLNIMIDTLKVFNNQPVPWNTVTFFTESKDKRVYLRAKKSPDIPNMNSNGDYGIGVYKFTAKTSNGDFPPSFSTTFANTDFPIFRYADALLMQAEAKYRLGDNSSAAALINLIRERAFGNTSENVTPEDISDELILNERAREFYYEAQRRTDLIRFGQFTNGTYHWAWKGGVQNGVATSPNLNVYPIPVFEMSTNPNIIQNSGY